MAAELATLGSTVEARKATVDITGLPDWENGNGWYERGPEKDKNKMQSSINGTHNQTYQQTPN